RDFHVTGVQTCALPIYADAPEFDPAWLEQGLPVLGVCYGMQLLSLLAGAPLHQGARREYGLATVELCGSSPLLKGFTPGERITRSEERRVGKECRSGWT